MESVFQPLNKVFLYHGLSGSGSPQARLYGFAYILNNAMAKPCIPTKPRPIRHGTRHFIQNTIRLPAINASSLRNAHDMYTPRLATLPRYHLLTLGIERFRGLCSCPVSVDTCGFGMDFPGAGCLGRRSALSSQTFARLSQAPFLAQPPLVEECQPDSFSNKLKNQSRLGGCGWGRGWGWRARGCRCRCRCRVGVAAQEDFFAVDDSVSVGVGVQRVASRVRLVDEDSGIRLVDVEQPIVVVVGVAWVAEAVAIAVELGRIRDVSAQIDQVGNTVAVQVSIDVDD